MSLEKILAEVTEKYHAGAKKSSAYNNNVNCYVTSNQTEMKTVYDKLLTTPSLKMAKKENLAILIGESFFLSLLPALAKHVDTVLMLDVNPALLKYNLFALDCIRNSKNREEFGLKFFSSDNPVLKLKLVIKGLSYSPDINAAKPTIEPVPDTILDKDILFTMMSGCKRLLNGVYFLESDENYQRARQAAVQLKLYTLEVDFFDNQLMAILGRKLFESGFRNRIINTSNLYDYDGNYALRDGDDPRSWHTTGRLYKTLALLFDRPDEAQIIHCIMDYEKKCRTLKSCLTVGLVEFERETHDYSTAINAGKIVRRYALKGLQIQTAASRLNLPIPRSDFDFNKMRDIFLKPERSQRLYVTEQAQPSITSRVASLLNQLRDCLHQSFPNSSLFYYALSSEYYLVDATIITTPDYAEQIAQLLMKYELSYRSMTENSNIWLTILDANLYLTHIEQLITDQTTNITPRPS